MLNILNKSMKIISTNLAKPRTIFHEGRAEQTGIFKEPVDQSLFLGQLDVAGDTVADRVHHAGVDKACYLYGYNHYPFWQDQYPHLAFAFGMFGENLTIDHLDESVIRIGDIFNVGSAVIQVTQPRQPCHKLGIKFNAPQIINQFQNAPYPGVYVRVLQPGTVTSGDELIPVNTDDQAPNVLDIYRMLFAKSISQINEFPAHYLTYPTLAERVKEKFRQRFGALI